MIIHTKIQELFKSLAIKHNLPIHVIEEIYISQFRKLREEIRSLDFKTIKLPAWGKYIASQRKVKRMPKYNKIKDDRKTNSTNNNQDNALEGS